MHKLYNQATCQEVAPKPETRQRQRRMRGERDTEGELSQVLNVAMANDALKPKTKQLPKSFRKEQGREGRTGDSQVAWLVAWPAC